MKIIKVLKWTWYLTQDLFPKNIVVGTDNVTNSLSLAEHFRNVFTKIVPKLANKTEKSIANFDSCMKKCNSMQPKSPVSTKPYNINPKYSINP